jgi:hypothetical protein
MDTETVLIAANAIQEREAQIQSLKAEIERLKGFLEESEKQFQKQVDEVILGNAEIERLKLAHAGEILKLESKVERLEKESVDFLARLKMCRCDQTVHSATPECEHVWIKTIRETIEGIGSVERSELIFRCSKPGCNVWKKREGEQE